MFKVGGGTGWRKNYHHHHRTLLHYGKYSSYLLCTITSRGCTLCTGEMPGTLIVAVQLYWSPWEVRRLLNIKVRLNSTPLLVVFVVVRGLLLLENHSRIGSTAKYSMTEAVQVRERD